MEMKYKYYLVPAGCMGLINGKYRLFATETEYFETGIVLGIESYESGAKKLWQKES